MQVMQDAQLLEATGQDIMHLEVGQPSTPPPDAVNRALSTALGSAASHGYSVALGQPALRQRISAHYQDWYSITPDWNQIAITPGSSLGFAWYGEEVASFSPFFFVWCARGSFSLFCLM